MDISSLNRTVMGCRRHLGLHMALLVGLLLGLTGTLSGGVSAAGSAQYEPPHDQPGPAAEHLYFKAFNVDRAPLDIEAGEMDLYYYSLKIAAARELQDSESVRLYEAPASTISLILNPAPAPEGQLNPFSLPAVRRAMQQLVDREFVAREIYQGQATPMYTNVSPSDFDYLTIFDIVQAADLRYDPEFARDQISRAMEEAGATLVDGVWHYNERPIRLKFVIRVEDERREVGDLIRTALGEAGFQVDATYQPFAPAIQTVYSSDPQQFSWHLYTEGWGRGAPQRYDFGSINTMYAPWLGNMPGWREVGFWQYENERLDELGQRLFRGEFADQSERDEIYRQMTRLALDESVRVWIATVMNAFPVQTKVQGVTQDLAAGPKGLWTLREAYVPDSDALTVGNLWVWTERTTWNPVGGFGDVYSTDIWRNLQDPPLWNHPFTGIPGPFRADYTVDTAGPEAKLDVPTDAMTWDVQNDAWIQVGETISATSKVTFDYSRYFQAPWHHGQPITMADVLYSIYQSFDLSYDPDKARIETVIATTSRPYLETIKGFRVLDENRIEVYVDFWHFEPDYIAAYASPAGLSTPWELLYALDTLVFDQRRAAYSDTAAARFNVPWISLVLDRDARLVRKTLLDLRDNGTFPTAVFTLPGAANGDSLVDEQTAIERYNAVLDWFEQRGHLIISNGPFTLVRYDPPAQFAELQAFRHPDYPFKPGDLYKGQPELIEFVETDAPPIALGEAYEARIRLDGPGTLGIRYLLIDAASGDVVQQGDAAANGDNQFVVALDAESTNDLDFGLYRLTLAAYSDRLAQMAERSVQLEADIGLAEPAASEETGTAEASAETATPTTGATETASESIQPTASATAAREEGSQGPGPSGEATSETADQATSEAASADGGLSTNTIALIAVVAVVIVAAVALWRRRSQG